MARELWSEVMANTGAYFPKDTKEIRALLATLGSTKNLMDLIGPIMKIIDHLEKL
jgi:hypothetical protein